MKHFSHINLFNVYNNITKFKPTAIGYPVNRQNSFEINHSLLGISQESFATTYINNVASPYPASEYIVDDVKDVERALIEDLFLFLNGSKNNCFGYVTSGGTEANLAAIWWHRNYLQRFSGESPIILAQNESHYSLDKIADILNLAIIKYSVLDDLKEKLLTINKPVIFWANCGTTTTGMIDDLREIKKLLTKLPQPYKIHCDGAIYGLLMPFLECLDIKDNLFSLIDTLTISTHKYLGSNAIRGIILTTDSYIKKVFHNKEIDYIRNAVDVTVSGSRDGLGIIEIYLLFQKAMEINLLGISNLEDSWIKCKANTKYLLERLSSIVPRESIKYIPGQLTILFPRNKFNTFQQKYDLMPVGDNYFGVSVFPSRTKEVLDVFLNDYNSCYAQ